MPKKNKKNSQREVADDFDDMLAGFRASDLATAPLNQVPEISSADVAANAARAQASRVTVPEATILAAIRAGDLSKLRRWHQGELRYSPDHLCTAAAQGVLTVMRCMIEELGADVNGATSDGTTPVYVACHIGHLDLVRYMVGLGADVKKANATGASPLFVAAQEGRLDIVRYLIRDFGAFVNQAAHDGLTPIMIAAESGHVNVVRCLGKVQGADVNFADSQGATALIFAAQCGHLDVVQCLVSELGADVNLAAHDGRTALMMASLNKSDKLKVVRWLVRNGANVQAATIQGTAVDFSRDGGAPISQTQYLEAKTHCSHPGCSGAGLKKRTGCKQARYCGQTCQLAHWKAHKADCNAHKKL
jgi:hypothetical protein